jgi:hypothetical protein
METIIFALIGSYIANRHEEPAVAEPEVFQPFDLQALRRPWAPGLARRRVAGRYVRIKPSDFLDYELKI